MTDSGDILQKFHPIVRSWFTRSFGQPSPPQLQGWPSISERKNTLIVAPTGSGKTLAAFLWCINHLVEENIAGFQIPSDDSLPKIRSKRKEKIENRNKGIRVLYVSPLKALNNDIHRNLEVPLNGILSEAEAQGIPMEEIRSAVRTGDTTQTERARMLRNPPDILITTPESLFLMLSSEKSRALFHSVQYVIVDEIHSISNTKRGVHLSLTLERLEELVAHSRTPTGPEHDTFVRIGLSATQRPLEAVAQFLGGMVWKEQKLIPRPVNIIDAGYKKSVDLKVICAARDFSDMPAFDLAGKPLDSIWSLIFPQLIELIREHRTTLIFVNNRRLAERVAAKLNDILEGAEDTTNNYAVPFFSKKNYPIQQRTPSEMKSDIQVFAYHGSMSRTVREQLESDLKLGKLRVLITTSALELGIDIGTVDLVVQIQSPKGIARGLQRVGRSGHLVNANSKGRLFVTHREDLVESAVVAQGMKDHAIERTFIPQNCLDVLAQQIVAMVGLEDWNVEELYDLIRQSYCYQSLGENVFHSVLEMLAGRYTNDAFRELRARIVWNKLHNQLSALPGSSLLAVTNAGTIPDRGYFGVYLEDQKTKVGEVDEEFIYESRAGDTFILGSNVWRMMDIDANKVIVSPAPGQPARMPFWRGEGIGRTYELGVRIGEFLENISVLSHSEERLARRFLGGSDEESEKIVSDSSSDKKHRTQNSIVDWLNTFPIDANSRRNIIEYVEEQRLSTSVVPSHRTLVVEGFRDEVGDPRIVVHSCYGKGVNGLLGIVLTYVLKQRLGIDIQMLYNNDGILFRCSDAERLPLDLFSGISLDFAQQIVLEEIPSSPLFGALFRQNAERSLLLPKGSPGKRRPFFLQRLKSADLLQIVRQYNDFPIVIETIRECLTDVLDFEHFKEIVTKIGSGEIRIHTVQNDVPSPFASTVLFDFAAVYMYQWDDPKQNAQQQFALLNRELIAEVVELDTVKSVVRRDAVAKVEEQLQYTSLTRKARSAEELMDIFLRLGELTRAEAAERVLQQEFVTQLLEKNILTPVIIGGKEYLISSEELPLYRPFAEISTDVTASLPEPFRSASFERDEALRYVTMRMLRSHGTLTAREIAERFAISREECTLILTSLKSSESLISGELTDESSDEQWCYRPNFERIHRASISLLRKEIKPATVMDFTRLLLRWQHRDHSSQLKDESGVKELLETFEGYALASDLWESEILRTRIQHYQSAIVRQLTQRGEFFCIGTPSGRSQWIGRGNGNYFAGKSETASDGLSHTAVEILHYLKQNGASFLSDLRENTQYTLGTINHAVAELFWAGLITNDIADEALKVKRYRESDNDGLHLPEERIKIVNYRTNPLKRIASKSVREAFKQVPGWNGRWSLVHTKSILGNTVTEQERIRRQAEQLLLRYGIVAREIAKREENLLPWTSLAMEFQRMEMRGEIRRGYFVEGLSGMQFALPEAVTMLDEIKATPAKNEPSVLVNACDPAVPFGSGIDPFGIDAFPGQPKFSRMAGNYLILNGGIPIGWIENMGSRIVLRKDAADEHLKEGLLLFVEHLRRSYPDMQEIITEYVDGSRPSESGRTEMLRTVGFYRDKVQTMRLDLR